MLSREGHNLSYRALTTGATECSIRPYAGFFAKNATPEDIPQACSFPGIAHLFDDKDPDRLLCPVRAITIYVKRTTPPDSSDCPGRLFRHYKPGTKFRKTHISRWLVDTILLAYENSHEDSLSIEGITAHQVRGMAASWAYYRDTPLTEIRGAVGWKSAPIFAQHYLRDIGADDAVRDWNVPVVAAGRALTR